jgi:hypothetical protein
VVHLFLTTGLSWYSVASVVRVRLTGPVSILQSAGAAALFTLGTLGSIAKREVLLVLVGGALTVVTIYILIESILGCLLWGRVGDSIVLPVNPFSFRSKTISVDSVEWIKVTGGGVSGSRLTVCHSGSRSLFRLGLPIGYDLRRFARQALEPM